MYEVTDNELVIFSSLNNQVLRKISMCCLETKQAKYIVPIFVQRDHWVNIVKKYHNLVIGIT